MDSLERYGTIAEAEVCMYANYSEIAYFIR
jgi:hypothetical protein